MAQAQVDIQEMLPLAVPAVDKRPDPAVRRKPEELHRPAVWTEYPSVL